jgi:CheY-like chemotaxis protein
LEYLSVFTALPSIPAPVWVLQFANASLSAQAGVSGLNLSPEMVRHFSLRFQSDTSAASAPSRKPQILRVEDNRADAGLVLEALEEHATECELTLVTDGESAVKFIQDVEGGEIPYPDLVILDLNLPRVPGLEVLAYIRASQAFGQVPVVILSSSDAHKDREAAAWMGATRYIRKPSRLAEFIKLGDVFKELLSGEPRA